RARDPAGVRGGRDAQLTSVGQLAEMEVARGACAALRRHHRRCGRGGVRLVCVDASAGGAAVRESRPGAGPIPPTDAAHATAGAAAAAYGVDAPAAARRGADIREDAALPRRRARAAPETAVIVACGKASGVEPSCDPAAEGG